MNFSRTLLIKPSSMGDVVQALPVLTALKEAHPQAHVSWLVARPFAGLLEGHPRLDDVVVFDRHRFAHIGQSVTIATEFWSFLQDLRARRFTTVIDLQGLLRSGLFALATGAPNRIGFREARELAPLFYTAEVAVPGTDVHAVDRYLAVARHLGLAMPKATDHLPVSEESRAAARARLAEAASPRTSRSWRPAPTPGGPPSSGRPSGSPGSSTPCGPRPAPRPSWWAAATPSPTPGPSPRPWPSALLT